MRKPRLKGDEIGAWDAFAASALSGLLRGGESPTTLDATARAALIADLLVQERRDRISAAGERNENQ